MGRVIRLVFVAAVWCVLFNCSVVYSETSNGLLYVDVSVPLSVEEREYLGRRGPIRFSVDPSWAPYEWIDESGEYRGVGSDYIKLLSGKLGVAMELVPTRSWEETLEFVKAGSSDVVPLLNRTKEREEYLGFTSPYVINPAVIVTRDDVSDLAGFMDLAGKTVAVVKGYNVEDILRERYLDLSIVPVANNREGLRLVASGEVFSASAPLIVASLVIEEEGLTTLKLWGHDDFEHRLRMGIRKDDPILLGIMQKAVLSLNLKESSRIFDRWNPLASKGIDQGLFWSIVVLLIVLIASASGVAYRFVRKNDQLRVFNRELAKVKAALEEGNRRLELLSKMDHLTGIANRFGIEEFLNRAVLKARRGTPFCVAIGDVDHFKRVNDDYGHQVGDRVLVRLAEILVDAVRAVDLVGRWGGEEFIIVFDDMVERDLFPVTDRIRRIISESDFGLDRPLTVSFGGAAFPAEGDLSLNDLLRAADGALYRAKEDGRNRVAIENPSVVEKDDPVP
ncbi:MAG: diguanylate cyclase [Synergistota bacterium]|nr:diguanylate cyclase [Synergistota bacterium]